MELMCMLSNHPWVAHSCLSPLFQISFSLLYLSVCIVNLCVCVWRGRKERGEEGVLRLCVRVQDCCASTPWLPLNIRRVIKSKTGSGKTLAYLIPIVEKLQQCSPRIERSSGTYGTPHRCVPWLSLSLSLRVAVCGWDVRAWVVCVCVCVGVCVMSFVWGGWGSGLVIYAFILHNFEWHAFLWMCSWVDICDGNVTSALFWSL